MPETESAIDVPDTAPSSFGGEAVPFQSIGGLSVTPAIDVPDAPAGASAVSGIMDPAKIERVTGELADIKRRELRQQSYTDQREQERIDSNRDKMARAHDAEGEAKNAVPPPWNADKEREKRTSGPLEQFGSIGSVFAMMASAFTRTPMTSALNAGAAAMRAIQEHDEKGYASAYQAWKDNTDLALKRFNMERALFDDANKLLTSDMNAWSQKTAANAMRFGNEKILTMLENGMAPEVLEVQSKMTDSALKLASAQRGMEEFNRDKTLFAQGKKAFKDANPNATSLQDVQNSIELIHSIKSAERGVNYSTVKPDQLYMSKRVPELMKPVDEGGLGLTLTEALRQSEREYSEAKKSGGPGPAAEIKRRTADYEGDPNSPTYQDHNASYERAAKEVKKANTLGTTLTDEDADFMAEQYLAGDKSVVANIGRGGQGPENMVKFRSAVAKMSKAQGLSGADIAKRLQAFQAETAGLSAEARVGGGQSANIDLILRAAHAALPAAIEASEKVPRTSWVPINKLAQTAEGAISDPALKDFRLKNIQLAELWARGMNPKGVMRESDRQIALDILSTADSKETYRVVVQGVLQFLERERTAVKEFRAHKEPEPVVLPPPGGGASGGDPSKMSNEELKKKLGL